MRQPASTVDADTITQAHTLMCVLAGHNLCSPHMSHAHVTTTGVVLESDLGYHTVSYLCWNGLKFAAVPVGLSELSGAEVGYRLALNGRRTENEERHR